ncbi:MAG: hypothetical protein JXA82_18255 [Sedimentisphaerales bacterium]|nr:hypothetical protein [Sedimentisphaerales bacterium]
MSNPNAPRAERLLDTETTAFRLGIHKRTLFRHRHELIAKGLKRVRVGQKVCFTESSVTQLIHRAVERDEPLY